MYGYNGKEKQADTGWDDYGARMYMPELGRWGVVDPLAEKHLNLSPYVYCTNNPVKYVDADGRDWGVRVNHDNKTIVVEANYYFKNINDRNLNSGALQSWNSIGSTYKTKDGVEYKVIVSLQGKVIEAGENLDTVARKDLIGNTVTELSNEGYGNRMSALFGDNKERAEQQREFGGGVTQGYKITNKSSVANNKTRAHEMGHTLGLGENEGGVMDYAETSFGDMSTPSVGNVNTILNRTFGTATNETNKIDLSKAAEKPKTFDSGSQSTRITITGTYDGKKGF